MPRKINDQQLILFNEKLQNYFFIFCIYPEPTDSKSIKSSAMDKRNAGLRSIC